MRVNKLLVPEPGGSIIARARLDTMAQRLLELPLALVTAGGGFGKSTIMSAWARRLQDHARVAWLTLEPADASASASAEALERALRQAVPHVARPRSAHEELAVDAVRSIATLCNELYAHTEDAGESVILFVDDVHVVDDGTDGAVAVLAELLRAAPPKMHVVLASRTALTFAPIAKLRAQGRVLDVDEAALRFTAEEAAELIGDRETAAGLHDRTEGWPIALALTSRVSIAATSAIDALGASRKALFDFLADEVLRTVPQELRAWLFALALPQNIDMQSAGALLDSGNIGAIVASLAERGLYLTRVDEQTWRFHHLFREFLLDRFRRDDALRERQLRRKYAAFLRERGDKMEALAHLIEAGDFLEIVEYVREAQRTIRFTDQYRKILSLLANVPAGIKREHPMLYQLYGLALARSGAHEAAREQLELCYATAMETSDLATACVAQIELGVAAGNFRFQGHGDFAQSERHFERAVELARGPELAHKPVYKKTALWFYGMALAQGFKYREARVHLESAGELEHQSGSHVSLTVLGTTLVDGWTGDWRAALENAQLAEELYRSGGGEFQLGHAFAAQAQALIHLREDLQRASQLSDAAIESYIEHGHHEELGEAFVIKGRSALASVPPDLAAATLAADEAERWLRLSPNPTVRFELALIRSEAGIIAQKEAQALRCLDEAALVARSNGDKLQEARVEFNRAIADLVFGRTNEALQQFVSATETFQTLGDAYHAIIARLAALGCALRADTVNTAAVTELFDRLEASHCPYAIGSASRSATAVLTWCARNAVEVERAERLLTPYIGGDLSELCAVAENRALAAASRAAAIRALAKTAPAQQRDLIVRLARDGEPLVAGTATAMLEFLPNVSAPAMKIAVVGELRVHIGAQSFDERDERWGRKRSIELLRLLAISGPMTKSAVIESLWPDNESGAETTLRVTLHLLRRALEPNVDGAGNYVEYDGAILRLRSQMFSNTDALDAESAVRRAQLLFAQGDLDGSQSLLERAIAIFRGAPREGDVSQWLRPHVRSWRERCVEALGTMASIQAQRADLDAAVATLQTALAFEPLDEPTVCALLDLHLRREEIEKGRAVFVDYKRKLAEELGLAPGPAALERYSKILAMRSSPARRSLSDRELEVLSLVARGHSNKEIAAQLALSPWTVNNHLARILKKLGVENRAAAVAMAGGLLDG